MDSFNPLISILIPTWNRPQGVARLVGNINSHEHADVEIIITDDNSTEENWSELQSIANSHGNVRLFRNPKNLGLTGNWNEVIKHAKGKWLGFVCDDDIYKEDAIPRLRSIIKNRENIPFLVLQNTGMKVSSEWLEKGVSTVNKIALPPASGQFWHSEITQNLGGFDPRIKYCPDAEFWPRIAYHYPVLRISDYLVIPVQHETNYMWEIFKKEDFIGQISLYARICAQYQLEGDCVNERMVSYKIDDCLWETYRTTINNTFLKKNHSYYFNKYLIEFIKLSIKMKRKRRMLKILVRLLMHRLYQPIKPYAKNYVELIIR